MKKWWYLVILLLLPMVIYFAALWAAYDFSPAFLAMDHCLDHGGQWGGERCLY